MKIVLATRNDHKRSEIEKFLNSAGSSEKIELLTLNDIGFEHNIIENVHSFDENALIKARAVKKATDLPVIADDSGLCVDYLCGAPGVLSARYFKKKATDEENNEFLLGNMKHATDRSRSARFVCVIAYVDENGTETLIRGECHGEILREYRGDNGFGYDPLFYYPPLDKTFAEMSQDEKNEHSHRGVAMKRFLDFVG